MTRRSLARLTRLVLAVSAAGLLLAACTDDIPVFDGDSTQGPDTEYAAPLVAEFVPASYFTYSVSDDVDWGRTLYISYAAPAEGALWYGISLEVSCGAWTRINLENFPWQAGSSGTVTFSIDDQPRASERVELRLTGVPVSLGSHETAPSTNVNLGFVEWYQVLRSSEDSDCTTGRLRS